MCKLVVCKRHATTCWKKEDGTLTQYDPHCSWNGCTSNPEKNFTEDINYHQEAK